MTQENPFIQFFEEELDKIFTELMNEINLDVAKLSLTSLYITKEDKAQTVQLIDFVIRNKKMFE